MHSQIHIRMTIIYEIGYGRNFQRTKNKNAFYNILYSE